MLLANIGLFIINTLLSFVNLLWAWVVGGEANLHNVSSDYLIGLDKTSARHWPQKIWIRFFGSRTMRVFLALLRKNPLAGGPSLTVQTIKPSPPAATTTAKDKIVNALFGKYLLLTNTLSSGFLMVAGDFMSQQIENKKKGEAYKHNSIRSGNSYVLHTHTLDLYVLCLAVRHNTQQIATHSRIFI